MINLKTLTIEEKLHTMELLWDDLCHESSINSPDWHQDILAKRDQQLKDGSAHWVDWKQSKENIRKRTEP